MQEKLLAPVSSAVLLQLISGADAASIDLAASVKQQVLNDAGATDPDGLKEYPSQKVQVSPLHWIDKDPVVHEGLIVKISVLLNSLSPVYTQSFKSYQRTKII